MLVLWTRNSSSSQAVQYEINRATMIRKRIIPAVESSLTPPESLQDLVYVKFDYYDQVQAIKAVLRSLLNYEAETQGPQDLNAIFGFLALLTLLGAASGSK